MVVNVFAGETTFPQYLLSAFSRLKVSTQNVQSTINSSLPSLDVVTSKGAVTGNGANLLAGDGSVLLTAGSDPNSLYRYRTKTATLYQGGKEIFVFGSFNFLTLESSGTGIKKRFGLFYDPDGTSIDGIYLEQDPLGDWYWILAKDGVETRVVQSNWNQDPFDGTREGLNLDKTKAHIAFIYFEWLGAGNVSVGFLQNGKPVLAHVFEHGNALVLPYMRTANLFLTYEIENGSGGTANMIAICAAALTEQGVDNNGVTYGCTRPINNNYNTSTRFRIRPLILFSLKPDRLTSRVIPKNFGVTISSNAYFQLHLVRDASFSDGYTPNWNANTDTSSIQVDLDPPANVQLNNTPALIGGSPIGTSPRRPHIVLSAIGNQTSDIATSFNDSVIFLGSHFDNTPETWALCISCTTANETVNLAYVNFFEQL